MDRVTNSSLRRSVRSTGKPQRSSACALLNGTLCDASKRDDRQVLAAAEVRHAWLYAGSEIIEALPFGRLRGSPASHLG